METLTLTIMQTLIQILNPKMLIENLKLKPDLNFNPNFKITTLTQTLKLKLNPNLNAKFKTKTLNL
jgi:hypothetical protein